MVAALYPSRRRFLATLSDNFNRVIFSLSKSLVSSVKVISLLIDLGGEKGITLSSSIPLAKLCMIFPDFPKLAVRISIGIFASSPMVSIPILLSSFCVALPTPHNIVTGNFSNFPLTSSFVKITNPSGFSSPDANFAKNLLCEIPAEQVSFVFSNILFFIFFAISTGKPNRLRAPVTSKNASSQPTTSTSGVKSQKISLI